MDFALSDHARLEMSRRGISDEWVRAVMANPEQIIAGVGHRKIYQSRLVAGDKTWLVRVVVEEWHALPVVVTTYRTSKIEKYWRAS
jgi:hypothetical protein